MESDQMTKPIDPLIRHLFPSLRTIAPEKANELEEIIQRHNLELKIEDTEESFFFTANPQAGKIKAGNGALCRLWAIASGSFCLYTNVAEAKQRNIGIRELDLKESERMRRATRLLEWVIQVEYDLAQAKLKKQPVPKISWPSDAPHPVEHPVHASDEHVADELFLCAGAFILHHDLAHIRLEHEQTNDPSDHRKLETEADMAAASWILDGVDKTSAVFTKRLLGVALGLVWPTIVAVFAAEDQTTYPPSFERLMDVMGRYVDDPNHVVWAFVGTMLRATAEARRMKYDENREATAFRDDVEYCIEVFKNYQAKSNGS
jgi:hypothetical protein